MWVVSDRDFRKMEACLRTIDKYIVFEELRIDGAGRGWIMHLVNHSLINIPFYLLVDV